MKLLSITKSERKGKKKKAVFILNNGRTKTVHFGGMREDGTPYIDYTLGASEETRKKYIQRHRSNAAEMRATRRWTRPTAAGTLSRYLLWEHKSPAKALSLYRKKFSL